MKYQPFDHTADIGVRIYGNTEKTLFEHAAEALFSFISETRGSEKPEVLTIGITGDTLEDLFMNWLRELLSLFTIKERLVIKATVSKISETSLLAELCIVPYDPEIHEIQNEIKAVTYHGLIVEKRDDGWFAQVIFDI